MHERGMSCEFLGSDKVMLLCDYVWNICVNYPEYSLKEGLLSTLVLIGYPLQGMCCLWIIDHNMPVF